MDMNEHVVTGWCCLVQFNNLVVDKNTGRVYIGAVNKLYQLSPNLELTVGGGTSYSSVVDPNALNSDPDPRNMLSIFKKVNNSFRGRSVGFKKSF